MESRLLSSFRKLNVGVCRTCYLVILFLEHVANAAFTCEVEDISQ